MKLLGCALILCVGVALAAPGVVAHPAEAGDVTTTVRNPRKKPPPPPPEEGTRPPRRKDEQNEDTGEKRESRPQEPVYVPEQPVVVPIRLHDRCSDCMRYVVYCGCYDVSSPGPFGFVGIYAAATASTAIVNLLIAAGGPPDEQLAAAGLVLGGVGFLAASWVNSEERSYYAMAGIASVALGVLNLISEPADRPDRTEPIRASIAMVSFSF